MGGRCEMPPSPLAPGLRRRRNEDDINDLESSPPRRRKVVPMVDLTKGGKLIGVTRGLDIASDNGYSHRMSDVQFDSWIPSAQSRTQSSIQKYLQPFSLKPVKIGQLAQSSSPSKPPKAGLASTPLGFPMTSLSGSQILGTRVNWAIGTLPRAAFRADSPPPTPTRKTPPKISKPGADPGSQQTLGQTSSPHSLFTIPTQFPYPKTTGRPHVSASPPQTTGGQRELELDSIFYSGHTLRARKTVELQDGTFLRIAVIKNRINADGDDRIFLQGQKFQRAREFLGLLALKKNEVAMNSICETISLSEVLKPRILIVTNANFPKYRDITGDEEVDEREGRLICRWRITVISKHEGYIWRLQQHEVDKEYRVDDSELREQWRGGLMKVVEMLHGEAPLNESSLQSKDLSEQEGFLEWTARKKNFVDLTAGKQKQREEGVKETHLTEIITKDSSLELKRTSYEPFQHGGSSRMGGLESSRYEATIDSRTPSGRFLGYFKGTYTPNPSISSPNPSSPSLQFATTDSLRPFIASPPQTPQKPATSPLRPFVPSIGDSDKWNSNRKQFGVFNNSDFSPFNSPTSKQTYHVSGRPLTFGEGNFRSSSFLGNVETQKSMSRSNIYDNLRNYTPSIKGFGLPNTPPSTPTKHGTFSAKSGLSSILENNAQFDLPTPNTGFSKKPNFLQSFDSFLQRPPPPQPVFTPGFVPPARRKYKFGDAFCGGGGMSSGAHSAGLINKWSFDFNIDAVTTYRRNFPDCETYLVSANDFVALPPEDLLVDVVHLSPPCQPHSPAHTIAGKDDDRNEASLFCVKECLEASRPRMVTLEQTDGILNRQEWFRSLVMCFTDLGFSVSWKVLHGVEYGVPQMRKRLFILAASPGESLPNFPSPKYTHPKDKHLYSRLPPARTVRDAIGYIPYGTTCHNPICFPTGFRPSPVDFDQPLKATILASGGPYDVHPNGLRPFTPRELASLQTFPVTHDFAGSIFQKKKQIGNAVPPALAEALLREVKRAMEKADRERSKKKVGDAGVKKGTEVADVEKGEGAQTIIDIPDEGEGGVQVLQARKEVVVVNVD